MRDFVCCPENNVNNINNIEWWVYAVYGMKIAIIISGYDEL